MRKPWDTVKIKILLGYFFLVGIAAFTVWLIYSEILLYTDNESRMTRLNNKILYFNTVLTNLYQAEALERSYSQTGNPVYFSNYEKLMDDIYMQFDSLSRFSVNPEEKLHTDSIRVLLNNKRKNLKELAVIRKSKTSDDLYDRAMDQFNINKDSINALLNIRTIVTDKSESTYVEQKQRNFFERLKYAFNPKDPVDSIVQVNRSQVIQTDTIINPINPADTVIQFLTAIIEDIRKENKDSELQLARKQREVLAQDRTITLQLRQMLSIYERDIIVNSLFELNNLQDRIRMTTWYLVALGGLALLIIVFFIVLILKDITRSQRYRNELEQAKAYSDSLLKSKEQIMLSITHDIKSPLASVMGYARLLSETGANDKKDQYLESINKSGDHILKLISDLVDLTRLETGKLKFEYSAFNLYELMLETCSEFYPLASSKNLDFRLDYHVSGYKEYYSDTVRVKQILGNIISNAIKYTEQGSVYITVTEESSDHRTDVIKFEIKDTGIGISEEDSRVIFNEFTRVSDKYDGAGLGLSIAHKLVSLMRGEISLESKPGEGSLFTIRLPLEINKMPRNKDDEQSKVIFPEHAKIMLIDDDVVFLEMTAEVIEKTGMKVRKCNSVLHAIQTSEEFKPDLIITDLRMPGLNGMDLLTYMQRKSGRMIPVILLTGQDSPDTGGIVFSDIIKKPFNPEDLLNSIHKVTGRKLRFEHLKQAEPSDSGLNKYSLDQIRQFALDDRESMKRILVSFAESSYENLIFFDKYITDKNRKALSELAHKMIAMFRQLEAYSIVSLLSRIERDYHSMKDDEWLNLTRDTLAKTAKFVNAFCEEQKISL